MKPWKRAVLNGVLYILVYLGVLLVTGHSVDWKLLAILAAVYFVLNFVLYSILDRVSK